MAYPVETPTTCEIDVEPHIWDLGGTITAEYYNKTDVDELVGLVHADQDLVVKVTITLRGKIRYYLCDTSICVCLAYDACGGGPSGEICKTIQLEGDNDPCKTDTFCFTFDLSDVKLTAGECGKQYDICLTISSKDCCGKFGFIFGSCKDFHITVLPAVTDASGPDA